MVVLKIKYLSVRRRPCLNFDLEVIRGYQSAL